MNALKPLVLVGLVVAGSMSLSGCATMGARSEAQIAYNACTDSYNANRQKLPGNWAFVSGVTGGASTCYWHYGDASAADASNAAMTTCKAAQSGCYVYATNEGWSPWVKQISDNGGTVVVVQDDTNKLTTECKLGLFTAGVQTFADVVAVARGVNAPYDGSQIDPNLCRK